MFRFLLILILSLCWFNSAYALPNCKGSPLRISYFDKSREIYGSPSLERSWNNCFAEITRIEPRTGSILSNSTGWIYRGGYKNGKAHGLGRWRSLYSGCKVKLGRFHEGDFVEGKWRDCTYLFGKKESTIEGTWKKNCNGKRQDCLLEEKETRFSNISMYEIDYDKTTFYQSKGTSPLNSVFSALDETKRKIIQEVLKEKNYYRSSVDGLYGNNTKNALESFNKERFENLDLEKEDNIKNLLSAIIELNPRVETIQSTIEMEEKPKLTKNENTNELLDTNFSLDAKAPKENSNEQISAKTKTVKELDTFEEIKKDATSSTATINEASDNNKLEVSMFLCTSANNSQKLFQLSESSKLGDIGGVGYRFQEKENVLFGPSDNGTAFAKFSDNILMITSADDDWQGNCVRLQNDIAKTLKDRAGSSSSDATDLNRNVATEDNAIKIREEFISLSRNKRKHIQAALKSRGLYKSTIDGLYGKNTESAIRRYIDEEVSRNPSYQQKSIRVMLNELRNQFAYVPPKEKKIEKFETSKYTFNAIGSNPKMSARQAYEICEAVASSAALSAGNSRRRDYYSTDCSSFSSNSWSCTTSRGSGGGGFAAGFFDAWSRELDRSKAKRIALRGCMAENGWSVRKK